MNKAKSILFNTEMTKAILDGRKTVTRQIIKPQPLDEPILDDNEDEGGISIICNIDRESGLHNIFPPYQPGDVMYVRESFYKDVNRYMYKANYSDKEKFYHDGNEVCIKWHPSIHMPKEAARIWLKVTDVRVERLQEIDGGDLLKEGIEETLLFDRPVWNAFDKFKNLWDATIRKTDLDRYGWAANPFVWVIAFERCKKPESEV